MLTPCCQIERPHYDDSVRDPITSAKSEWTLLIYLTGIEDGVEGGEVKSPDSTLCASLEIRTEIRLDFVLQGRKR